LNIDDLADRKNQQLIGSNSLPSVTSVEDHHSPTRKKSITISPL
jgi:hypothetical protein